jgi:hypothetical protein
MMTSAEVDQPSAPNPRAGRFGVRRVIGAGSYASARNGLTTPDLKRLVVEIVFVSNRELWAIKGWIDHGCREYDLVFNSNLRTNIYDKALKILAPCLSHSLVFDVVHKKEARVFERAVVRTPTPLRVFVLHINYDRSVSDEHLLRQLRFMGQNFIPQVTHFLDFASH